MVKPIWFMHIPKTGGTSVFRALREAVAPERVAPWSDADVNQMVQSGGPIDIRPYRVMRAHYDIKLERYFTVPVFKITILRFPVDRVVSRYLHAQQRDRFEGTLLEYLDYDTHNFPCHNQMTRYFLGHINGVRGPGETDLTLVDQALAAARTFDVVGTINQWDEFMDQVHVVTGLPVTDVEYHVNRSAIPYHLSDREFTAILERNQLDMELYRALG